MQPGSVIAYQESPDPTTDILEQVTASLTDTAADHPWLAVLLGSAVAVRLVHAVRVMIYGRHPKDPQRLFVGAERYAVLARAGHRCEHHSRLFGRCTVTEHLQADHVHPHSRGGATSVANGQALCGPHNRRKGNRIPWTWELRRLARHRGAYGTDGVPTASARRR